MDVTKRIMDNIENVLKKLKMMNIIRSFTFKIKFGKIDQNLSDFLLEIDTFLRKCVEKIPAKPRQAEIRNVIGVLVRKKNIEDSSEPKFTENGEIKKFKCFYCSRSFISKSSLESHSLVHKTEKKFLCEYCGHRFLRYSSLMFHVLKHRTSSFPNEELNDRMKKFLQDKRDHGTLESSAFLNDCLFDYKKKSDEEPSKNYSQPPSEKNNSVHVNALVGCQEKFEVDLNKRLTCSCGQTFRQERSLKKHIRLRHIPERQNDFTCNNCNKHFSQKGKLNRHILSHERGQFQCSKCPKTFQRMDNLKRHIIQVHEDQKCFGCRFCKKMFSLRFNRDTHEKNVHNKEEMQCESCGKTCKNRSTLKAHTKIHEEKPLSCFLCSKTFRRKVNYRNHLQTKHKGISPYQILFDSYAKG